MFYQFKRYATIKNFVFVIYKLDNFKTFFHGKMDVVIEFYIV